MSMSTIKKWLSKKATVLGMVVASIAIIGSVAVLSSSNNAKAASIFPCDGNEIVDCGVTSIGQLKADYYAQTSTGANLRAVYASAPFNMNAADMADFFANYQTAWVYSNGDITLGGQPGGQQIATNAVTAGRDYIGSSPGHDCSGEYKNSAGVYVRTPACSFLSSPLQAFVYMPNGEFRFAVLLSCGNPVVATPIPPIYTCDALDARRILDSDLYTELAQVHVTTGNGATFKSVTYEWGDGTSSTYTNTLYKEHNYPTYGDFTIRAHVTYDVNNVIVSPNVNLACIAHVNFPQPEFACTGLSVTPTKDENLAATAVVKYSSANGANFKSVTYNWGDGSTTNTINTTEPHTYSKPGDYTVTAVLTYTEDGKTLTTPASDCTAKISFAQPEFACTGLTTTATKDESLSATSVVTFSSANGATFKNVTYNWGDGTNTTSAKTTETHSYAKYGNYTITASITYTEDGVTKTTPVSDCTSTISFTAPECTGLTLTRAKGEDLTVQAVTTYDQGNGKGITYKSVTYNWNDGNSTTVKSTDTEATHVYTTFGQHNVVATVNFTVNGQATPITSASCAKSITFTKPSTPTFACTTTNVTQDTANLSVQAVTSFTESKGVTFQSLTYDWGDTSNTVVTTADSNNDVSASHTYAQTGTYAITASIVFAVNGVAQAPVSSTDCQQQVNFPTPTPMCTIPGETTLPASSPECVPMCTIPGETTLPASSPQCVAPTTPTPAAPTTPLPNTGPGNIVGIFGLTTVLGSAGHYIYRKRFGSKSV